MTLKDYKPSDPGLIEDEEPPEKTDAVIGSTGFHEEINTLKIDKLSNRVTIISIIIPCIIGAILVFAYLDMKERVVDVDQTKNSQVKQISKQMEEKLNALDVKIAKNRFDLDKQLPEFSRQFDAFEGKLAKIAHAKADAKAMDTQLKQMGKRIDANAGNSKDAISRIKTIQEKNMAQLEKRLASLDETFKKSSADVDLFKEEFDARLLELSSYEQQIGEIRKDASLLDKKFRHLETKTVSDKDLKEATDTIKNRIERLEKDFLVLDQKLEANMIRLQKEIDVLIKSSADQPIRPQLNIDSPASGPIEQKPLTQ